MNKSYYILYDKIRVISPVCFFWTLKWSFESLTRRKFELLWTIRILVAVSIPANLYLKLIENYPLTWQRNAADAHLS